MGLGNSGSDNRSKEVADDDGTDALFLPDVGENLRDNFPAD